MEADYTQIQATDAGDGGSGGGGIAPNPPGKSGGGGRADRFVGHANLMSTLTIISRFAGLARDKTCSYFIGINKDWGAFWMGFQLPNLFRRIFGEGALTAIFVPIYTRTLERDGPDAANRLASATCTALALLLGAITLLGEAIAIPLAIWAQESNNRLAAAMTAIMLPYCISVCLVAILGAIASVHERFTEQAISPIVLNFLWIAGAILPVALFGFQYDTAHRVYWIAGSILLSGFVQVLLMFPALTKRGVRLRLLVDLRHPGLREIAIAMLPMILGMSAVQFNVYLNTQIAWWLSPDGHGDRAFFTLLGHTIHVPMDHGASAILSVAQRIYLLPVGIFGVSLATAIFPLMTKAATRNDLPELKRLLVAGLKKTLFLSLPASAGMIIVAKPLITLIYMGGKTGIAEVDRAYWASLWFCIGIWAFEAQMVILRTFYALRDTKTPMKVAVSVVALNFLLNLTLVWFLQEGGIALSTTLAAIVQGSILLYILRRRLGHLGLRALAGNVIRGLAATLIMVIVGLALSAIPMPWDHAAGGSIAIRAKLLTALIRLPLLVAASAAIYLGLAATMRMPEVREVPLAGRFFRALGRKSHN